MFFMRTLQVAANLDETGATVNTNSGKLSFEDLDTSGVTAATGGQFYISSSLNPADDTLVATLVGWYDHTTEVICLKQVGTGDNAATIRANETAFLADPVTNAMFCYNKY